MLEKLNQYKEIITLVVFFLGGFLWIENQFPTKGDLTKQINVLKCELDSYMLLTQLQMRVQNLKDDIQSIDADLAVTPSDPSPSIRSAIATKIATRQGDVGELKSANDQIAALNNDLGRQKCAQ